MRTSNSTSQPAELLAPPQPGSGKLLAQVNFEGATAIQVRAVMERYQLSPAAAVRMLVVEGIHARQKGGWAA